MRFMKLDASNLTPGADDTGDGYGTSGTRSSLKLLANDKELMPIYLVSDANAD